MGVALVLNQHLLTETEKWVVRFTAIALAIFAENSVLHISSAAFVGTMIAVGALTYAISSFALSVVLLMIKNGGGWPEA